MVTWNTLLLVSLNQKLSGQSYFSGDRISIADIQYYCEISTIMSLIEQEISKKNYPLLHEWYFNKMQEVYPVLSDLESKFKESLENYS